MNERQTEGHPEEDSQTPSQRQPEAAGGQPAQNAAEEPPEPERTPQPSQEAAAGPTEKPGGNVGRIALWFVLAVLVLLAFLDFRTKSAAQRTGDALRTALREKPIGSDLKASELGNYIQGKPTRETIEKVPREMLGMLPQDLRLLVGSAEVYTWKGIFREYTVTVFFSLGADPPVEAVEGPGQPPAQKEAPPKKEPEKE